MSHRLHHAIIVTAEIEGHINAAYYEAKRIFGETISPIIHSKYNAVDSFYIPPDGSSEGWAESTAGDERRAKFIECLKALRARNIYTQWVEVQFADEYGQQPTKVVRSGG